MGPLLRFWPALLVLVGLPAMWLGIMTLNPEAPSPVVVPICMAPTRDLPEHHQIEASDVKKAPCTGGRNTPSDILGLHLVGELDADSIVEEGYLATSPRLTPAGGSLVFVVSLERVPRPITRSLEGLRHVRLCRLPQSVPDSRRAVVAIPLGGDCSEVELEVVAVHRSTEDADAPWVALSVPLERFQELIPYIAARDHTLVLAGDPGS